MYLKLFILYYTVYSVACAYEGDPCKEVNGTNTGTCIMFKNCLSALEEFNDDIKYPQICGYNGFDPIVCCFNNTSNEQSIAPTSTPSSRLSISIAVEEPRCAPLPASLTSPKIGQIAFDKCVEYQDKYVYPCGRVTALAGGHGRQNHCYHKVDQLVVGGQDAGNHEFPHMALIGFGEPSDLDFKCGGSIVSEKFVLTAAHCSFEPNFGPATFIAIGVVKKHQAADQSKIYLIQQFINHPHYKSPNKYNDIALIETDRKMQLNQFTVPACLQTEPVDDSRAIATGWGLIHFNSRVPTETLQKVILAKTPDDECRRLYKKHRLFKRGFNESIQTCYGDRDMPRPYQDRYESKDTCPGDSGGPLQIKSNKIQCMYIIVGVTSNGDRKCASPDSAGVYTKVRSYVPWIESIVWPK